MRKTGDAGTYLLGAWEVEHKICLDKRLRRAMEERHVLIFETGEIAASSLPPHQPAKIINIVETSIS
jgi:hypothetical protein